MNPRHPKGESPLAGILGDSRAELIPCPVLRTLLNEGWIHCDDEGRVRLSELHEAMERLGLDPFTSQGLTAAAKAGAPAGPETSCPALEGEPCTASHLPSAEFFSVYRLREGPLMHNADTRAERDGYDHRWLDEMLSHSSEGGWLTLEDLARYHARRLEEDPGLHGQVQGAAEIAAMVHVFGKKDPHGELAMEREDLIRLYRDNRFPKGWTPPVDRKWKLPFTLAKFYGTQWFG